MKEKLIPYLSALLSAFLLTLASPGIDLWFLAYFALVPVILAASNNKRPWLIFFTFAFLYYCYNLRWVETSVSHFGGAPAIVGMLLVAVFAAVLALFWALFGFIYKRRPSANILAATAIVALEIVRANLFTGFPWLYLGHTQTSFAPAVQAADLGGEFLISLVVAYFNLALASFIRDRNRNSFAIASVVVVAVFSYGFLAEHREYNHEILKTRIIQPAYSQNDKWNMDKELEVILQVSELIRNSSPQNYDLLMLPESVYPNMMDKDFTGYRLMSIVSEVTPVLAGVIRNDGKVKDRKYYNSVYLFDGKNVQTYDKRHLVPFGEYFPLGTLFKPIDYYFFKGAEDFSAGTTPVVFDHEKIKAAPLVCYESAYSGLVRPQIEAGANMIAVVTNDSWFGDTQGPYQHMATDIMRAVEYRRSVVRAAQTGVSACIDPDGTIQAEFGLNKAGYLDCDVKTVTARSIFSVTGYLWLVLLIMGIYIYERRGRFINKH
ncbi:apolipoprotein N-acyltransferase [Seleniivibrio sp.]|uniref:apolipoprotein N-acyltransferase n=1 Tax=Seleniivibrio sp. TaxID=2898801 RepID=UPI0025F0441F|nr:apolipoprotein N-acyltransferase [Seleniivibrio sp.]